ncbi:hypothetical protein TRICI_006144 [Trichomonascus ciferrii]|uniref:Peptidase M20 dimerisation domain-containing protein n=1 Tax=Trichomonascus ciferrii TaxID=44093 RepID=A0A642UKI0_9ASCO|nr:hypothetical protein TRICI_006144 [Trichomonascus ciferrii]
MKGLDGEKSQNQVERGVSSGFARKASRATKFLTAGAALCATAWLGYQHCRALESQPHLDYYVDSEEVCPQADRLVPQDQFGDISRFNTAEYRDYSLSVYAGSVRVPTEVYDDMGPVDEDPRWNIFSNFREYLKGAFPLVYEEAKVERVAEHGLLFTLEGRDESLKPLLFMAHQDVVPVPEETIPRWTYPPFSGHFDGKYVWGRGSNDCKNDLIGILEALNALLEQGFEPRRTILASFGADEESGGYRTSRFLGKEILNRYGEDSILMIVDEGGAVEEIDGNLIANPSTGEKGNIELHVTINTKGGHASIPPDHTGIGIASEFIEMVESQPFEPVLTEKSPFFLTAQCMAKVDDSMPKQLRQDIFNMGHSCRANHRAIHELHKNKMYRYLMQTSQAVDIIHAGVKINALPEEVNVFIDSRIGVESDSSEVKNKMNNHAKQLAEKYNLKVEAFGETICDYTSEEENGGTLTIDTSSETLEPAPVTQTIGNPTWDLLAGTARHVLEDFLGNDGEPVTVAPGIMTGNTDTKHYWPLTRSIYRFNPTRRSMAFNEHSIDEHVDLDTHIEGVAFYYDLIRNVDQSDAN